MTTEASATQPERNLVAESLQFTIATAKDANVATEMVRGLKELERKILAAHDPVVESANKAHKAAVEARKAACWPVTEAINLLRRRISDFQVAMENARREEEMRLRWEAEEAIRKRREEELAECRRRDEEHRAKEESLRAILTAQGVEAGDDEEIIQPIQAPPERPNVVLPPSVYVPPVQAPKGVSFQTRVSGEVVSKRTLMSAIIEGKLPDSLMVVDQAELNRYVREHRDAVIPGVKVMARQVSRVA